MGNNLFGANISGVIANALGSGGPAPLLGLTLTQFTERPNPARALGKPLKTPTPYTSSGIEDQFSKRERERPEIQSNDVKILVLGDPLGNDADGNPVVPQEGDTIVFTDGVTAGKVYNVQDLLERDPDAATYLVHARP